MKMPKKAKIILTVIVVNQLIKNGCVANFKKVKDALFYGRN